MSQVEKKSRLNIAPDSIKRILVCQLRQIGDVLLATPAVSLLTQKFPAAEVHFLTEKKCRPILENNPDIDAIWTIDKKRLSNLALEVAFYWKVARRQYDIVVDFQQLPRCRWVVAFSRARIRLSFLGPWYNRWLYTDFATPIEGYAARYKASVLAPLGITWHNNRPVICLTEAEKQQADAFLKSHGVSSKDFLVTLDSTHRRITRRWPKEYFAQSIAMAAYQRPEMKFLMLYGPGEEDYVRQLAQLSGLDSSRAIVPEKMLDLRETAASIQKADLHLGTCSAPRHMAVALGTPSLVVRGATSPSWTFPSPEHIDMAANTDCQPCNKNHCDSLICLQQLRPEAVSEALLAHADRFRKFGKVDF